MSRYILELKKIKDNLHTDIIRRSIANGIFFDLIDLNRAVWWHIHKDNTDGVIGEFDRCLRHLGNYKRSCTKPSGIYFDDLKDIICGLQQILRSKRKAYKSLLKIVNDDDWVMWNSDIPIEILDIELAMEGESELLRYCYTKYANL